VLALELVDKVVDQAVIEVLAAKVGVTGRALDFEYALLDGEQRDIEGATAQIEDENVALARGLLVEAVGNGRGSWLVDDAEDVETGNQTGVLGGLALRVVEVGGHSHNGVVDSATEVGLSSLAHLGEDHGRDFLRGEGLGLALELDLDDGLAALVDDLEGEVLDVGLHLGVGELAANEALGVEDGVGRVHGHLVFGGITDETLGVGEGDERGRGAVALVVGNDFDAVISEDAHAGVGGSKVDADGWSHGGEGSGWTWMDCRWMRAWLPMRTGCSGERVGRRRGE
jgi:NAD-specific glutamate dehydrogenase